jgi:Cyclic nucleotide-binding domain/Major Facilitator Superfamily
VKKSTPGDRRSVLGRALGNKALRRVELAYVGFNAAEYGEWIAVLVYAYGHGGTTVAALVAAVQLAPCVIAAPVFAGLADRYPPGRVLAAGYVAQGVGMAATAAVMLAGAPPLAVYAAAIVAAVPFTIARPTQAALLPSVARTPDELTAANVVSNWSEGVGIVGGPVLAGLVVGPGGPGGVLAMFAAIALACAVVAWPVRDAAQPGSTAGDEADGGGMLGGLAALRSDSTTGFLVGMVGAQAIVIGALDVLNVVLAFQIIETGRSGVAYLNAAFGAGGIVGGVLTVALVGRRRLAPPLLVGVVVWGGAFAVLGVQSTTVGAFLLLGISGAARSLVDVSGRSLLQRVCDPRALARVFGVLEGLDMAGYAVGSLMVPVLAFAGGPRTAVVGVGLVLPVVMAVGLPRLLAIDAHATVPVVQIGLLRLGELFAPLPGPELEGLARSLVPVDVPAGTVIIREGDAGDRYYAVAAGEAIVTHAGAVTARVGRGEGFGEIALLRDVPRTATVTAATDMQLYMLEKDAFLAAVTGHAPTRSVADRIVSDRLPAVRGGPEDPPPQQRLET